MLKKSNEVVKEFRGPKGPIGPVGTPGSVGQKGYIGHVGPPGPIGVAGSGPGIMAAIDFASLNFGVDKKRILVGCAEKPPSKDMPCSVYIYFNGGGAEFWIREGREWVNWSYRER